MCVFYRIIVCSEEGVSHNQCSDLYCGPSGNSELESQTLDSVFARVMYVVLLRHVKFDLVNISAAVY